MKIREYLPIWGIQQMRTSVSMILKKKNRPRTVVSGGDCNLELRFAKREKEWEIAIIQYKQTKAMLGCSEEDLGLRLGKRDSILTIVLRDSRAYSSEKNGLCACNRLVFKNNFEFLCFEQIILKKAV